MKKQLFLLLALVTTVVLTSCNPMKNRIKGEVEAANRDCPISLGSNGKITGYEYVDDEVIMNIVIDKEVPYKVNALKNLKNYVKTYYMSLFANAESITMMKELKAAKAGMTIVLKGGSDNGTFKVKITPDEVATIADGNVSPPTAKDELDYEIAMGNTMCPIKVDELTILNKISAEDKCIVYNYTVDESKFDIDVARQNKAAIKEELGKGMKRDDLPTACNKWGYGLIYRYTGDKSGKSIEVKFENSEL